MATVCVEGIYKQYGQLLDSTVFNKKMFMTNSVDRQMSRMSNLLDVGSFPDTLGGALSTRTQYDVSIRQYVLLGLRDLSFILLELIVVNTQSRRVGLDPRVHGTDGFAQRTLLITDELM